MNTNPQEIVQQIRTQLEAILNNLLQKNAETTEAYAMERHLWTQMLQLGRSLMALGLMRQAEAIAPLSVPQEAEPDLPYHDDKERTYQSVFGEIHFQRRYYYRPGNGAFPLDAAMNLPQEAQSDLLHEWQEHLGVYLPYQQANEVLQSMLGRPFSNRLLQKSLLEDAEQVLSFYPQVPDALPDPQATLLVLQADGKGVPMVTPPEEAPIRRSKGQKPCRKKEAIVTTVYTLAPTPRTPQSVVASHFHPASKPEVQSHPTPHNKWLWATLEGKEAALAFTAKQVASQNGDHITHRVALTDGAEALQARIQRQFPDFTLVLDFIHADEYLWKAANALLGETSLERTAWVEARTLQMLCGQTNLVVTELRELAATSNLSAVVVKTLLVVAAYYERNLSFMEYDRYLALGFPIATGVIEGACRHLVKDRCEQSGMRWTQQGAEALLSLRSVAENGDWEDFHAYRRHQRQKTSYAYWHQDKENVNVSSCPLKLVA